MWVLFLLLSAVSQQGDVLAKDLHIEHALTGYDPMMTDCMDQTGQASKSAIFRAWQNDLINVEEKEKVVNSFVDVSQPRSCSPYMTETIVTSYAEYKRLSKGVISFVTEEDATTRLGRTKIDFMQYAGYRSLNNPKDVFLRNFFNQSAVEARFIKLECVTYTVRLLPFLKPVFTPAFEAALFALHEAAISTNSDVKKKEFRQFIRYYGTHFARTTQFGYAAHYGKLFTSQTKTPEEEAFRHKCMLLSAEDTLTPGVKRGCETVGQRVFRSVPDKCGEEEVEMMLTEIGRASTSQTRSCTFTTDTVSEPVAYTLEKISALFEESWIPSQLNTTALSLFFEEQLGAYSKDALEKAEMFSLNQTTWRHSFIPEETAGSPAPNKTISTVGGK